MKRNLTISLLILFVFLSTSVVIARPEVPTQYVQITNSNELGKSGRDYGWIEQASGFTEPSRGIHYMCAVDSNIVWASAYDGTPAGAAVHEFTKTVNGGELWTPGEVTVTDPNLETAMVFALDENKAWCPMHSGNPQGIYYTSDGGAYWTRQGDAGMYTDAASFPNVAHFWDENIGFAQGDPVDGYYELYTTTNGGTTWTRVPSRNIPDPLTGEFGIVGYYDVVGDTIWCGTNKGRVFKSTNKGYNWTVCSPVGSLTYVNIWFKDSMNGLLQDKGQYSTGTLYETSDGGEIWTLVSLTGTVYTNDMSYVPGTDNMYVSTGAAPGVSGASYSTDGGHTWDIYAGTDGTQFLATDWANVECGYAGAFNLDQFTGGMFKYTYVPAPLIPPINLQAVYDGIECCVDLTWEEPPSGDPEDLVYNTGSWTSYIYDCQPYAIRVTNPYDYAVPLKSVNFILYSAATPHQITGTVDVLVWEDEDELPGAILYTVEDVGDIPHNVYMNVDVISSGINLEPYGSVFVGIQGFDTVNQGLLAENATDQGRSFCFASGEWTQICEAYTSLTNIAITATILAEGGGSSPLSYNVYHSVTSGDYDDPIANVDTTYYADYEPCFGTENYYVVTAVYDEGESGYSNEASAYVEIATAVELVYDDGTAESGYYSGNAMDNLAVRMTPPSYPVKLIRIKYYMTNVAQQMIVRAWDDNGPNGEPGTQLIDPILLIHTSALVANDWNIITLSDTYSIVISSGDFYVGWMEAGGENLIGLDSNGPSFDRSWQYTGGTWFDYSLFVPQNMMMRAVVDTNVIVSNDDEPVVGTYLLQNYPNPVNGSTQIKYGIQNHNGPVEINIYNILGQKVDSIQGEEGIAIWNPGELPSGIYFYKLETANFTQTRKMLFIK